MLESMASTTGKATVSALFCFYVLLVRLFRYQRQRYLQELSRRASCKEKKDDFTNARAAEKEQTAVEIARQVQNSIGDLEFPFVYRKSLEFALFRTYAIPSISALLAKTKTFSEECGKRYDDTDLLIAELTQNPFDSRRSRTAIQRINAIHNMYKEKISNEDMIYVLSVFIFEPIRWIQKVEWRSLTPEECQATFVAWTYIGEKMGIRNIPKTLEEYDAWNRQYENSYMKYADTNVVVGNATMKLFLALVPRPLQSFGKQVTYCLMDSRLRTAMGIPDPNPTLQALVETLFLVRKVCLRYLFLPRVFSTRRSPFSASKANGDKSSILCPRYHIYERTYVNGYETEKLGTAPSGKLLSKCPRYK